MPTASPSATAIAPPPRAGANGAPWARAMNSEADGQAGLSQRATYPRSDSSQFVDRNGPSRECPQREAEGGASEGGTAGLRDSGTRESRSRKGGHSPAGEAAAQCFGADLGPLNTRKQSLEILPPCQSITVFRSAELGPACNPAVRQSGHSA
jgi:hypothetical protein